MTHWKNITLNLTGSNLEEISDRLMELEVLSVSIRDKRKPEDSNWFHESKLPISMHNDTHEIVLLVHKKYPTKKLLNDISTLLKLPTYPEYSEKIFKDKDWVLYTQNQFKEVQISERMRVIPPWQQTDKFKGISITIDPGKGFGTGSHPTTQLCLQWLDKYLKHGDTFLDYGAGSGVLSIAAMALGAKDAVGIEIDTHAIQNAKHNSELNSFKIPFYNDNAKILNHSFDIVCANILSNVLIDLSTELKSFTRKKLILSGILLDQIDKVIKVFSDWIELKHFSEKEGWVLLYGELES